MSKKLIICSVLLLSGCFEEQQQKELELAGYKQVKMTGMSYNWKCGKINALNNDFEAIKNGKKVSGTYCGAMFGTIHEN